jgi:hypothetical protein
MASCSTSPLTLMPVWHNRSMCARIDFGNEKTVFGPTPNNVEIISSRDSVDRDSWMIGEWTPNSMRIWSCRAFLAALRPSKQ